MAGVRSTLLSVGALAVLALAAAALAAGEPAPSRALRRQASAPLKSPADFQSIADPATRSVAIFAEAGRVITDPRCINCHPAGRSPTQGDREHPHLPMILAGDGGHGVAGLACTACHQGANTALIGSRIESIPGNPKWGLAPAQMSWAGQPLGQICEQIKDPRRNGGRSLAQIHDHMAFDPLVGWGWTPGPGRRPAPGTQAQFGQLIQAWIDTGARCPAV